VAEIVGDWDFEEVVVYGFENGELLGEGVIEAPESSYEIEVAVTNCTVKV
jgi:hypothetical protein